MAVEKVLIEDRQLGDYEMVVVIRPELSVEELEAAINNVSRFITEKGGVIASIEPWGKRKLAYPIKHFMEGNYVLARFKLKTVFCRELISNLRISEITLRHLLVKVGG